MTLEQLLQAGIHWGDLATTDSRFSAIGIGDAEGFIHLKAALVSLANLAEFEPTVRSSYQVHPEPAAIIKPLQKKSRFREIRAQQVRGSYTSGSRGEGYRVAAHPPSASRSD
jgi:hypothetical protein